MNFLRYWCLVTVFYSGYISALTLDQKTVDRFSKEELEKYIKTNVAKKVPITFYSFVVRGAAAVKLGITEEQLDQMVAGKPIERKKPVISQEAQDLRTARDKKSDPETIDALKKLRQKLIAMGGQEDLLLQLDAVEKAFQDRAEVRWELLDTFWDALLKKRGEGVPPGKEEKKGKEKKEEEEKKEIPEVVLQPQDPLATVDIKRLSEQDKKNSDAAFVGALKTISQEFFIWFDSWDAQAFSEKMKVVMRDKKLALPQAFDSLFDAYRYFVRNQLVALGVGTRARAPKFKKIDELRSLVGLPSVPITHEYEQYKGDDFIAAVQEKIGDGSWQFIEAQTPALKQKLLDNLDTLVATIAEAGAKAQKKTSIEISLRVFPGTLGAFMYEKMYKGDKEDTVFLKPLYELFHKGAGRNSIVDGLVTLLKPCVFDEAVLQSEEALRALEGMAINSIASQRALVKMDEKNWKPVGLSPLQEQASDLVVQELFKRVMAEIDDKELDEEGLLDKDYGLELYVDLNRLRINPDFYRFAGMLGEQADKKNDEQDPLKFFALFTMLFYDKNPAIIDPPFVAKNIIKQLLFSEDSLQAIIGTWGQPKEAFKKLVTDRRNRVLLTATVDPYTFLNAKLRPSSTYKQLNAVVADLQKRMKDKTATRRVLDVLKKDPPDLNEIVDAFKQLTGKDVAIFNKKITTIVQDHLKKLQVPTAALEMITETKKAYDTTKSYVDRTLKEKFESSFGDYTLIKQELYNRYYQNLFGITRTPDSVARAFTSLVGNLPKVAKVITGDEKVSEMDKAKKVIVTWVAPYGLLIKVFLAVKAEEKSAQESLTMLTSALTALNKAELPKGQALKELPDEIKIEASTIQLGGYKNKLGDMIKHVTDDYDVEAIIAEIDTFVKAAKINLEETIVYKRAMVDIRSFLITVMGNSILDAVKALASAGEHYEIPNLSISPELEKDAKKRKRNIDIYKNIKSHTVLKPLLDVLMPGTIADKLAQLTVETLDQTSTVLLADIKKLESVDDQAYGIIESFIKELIKKLKLLHDAAAALAQAEKALKEARAKAPEVPPAPEGIPVPPPLPGEIPVPPPPPPLK